MLPDVHHEEVVQSDFAHHMCVRVKYDACVCVCMCVFEVYDLYDIVHLSAVYFSTCINKLMLSVGCLNVSDLLCICVCVCVYQQR